MQQKLDELSKEVMRLRAETAVTNERLDALEMKNGGLTGYDEVTPSTVGDDRPELDVVRLTPDDAPASPQDDPPPAPADADEDRPVLKSTPDGKVIEATAPGGGKGGGSGTKTPPANE